MYDFIDDTLMADWPDDLPSTLKPIVRDAVFDMSDGLGTNAATSNFNYMIGIMRKVKHVLEMS